MTARVIRANYADLANIATQFDQQVDLTRKLLQRICQQKGALEGGDWSGQGAQAFYAEMNSQVVPTVKRLIGALEQAAGTTRQITNLMQQAENDAAALFRLQGATGPASASAPGFTSDVGAALTGAEPAAAAVAAPRRAPIARGGGGGRPEAIKNRISINDVNQHGFGSCFVMAPAAALAMDRPELLAQRIHDNGDGTYSVTLYHPPTSTPEIVQQVASGNQPGWTTTRLSQADLGNFGTIRHATSADPQELWPALIEEAYIRQAGQRGELGPVGVFGIVGQHVAGVAVGGYPEVALQALTGVESKTFNPGQTSLADLQEQFDKHNPIIVGTPNGSVAQAGLQGISATVYGDAPVTTHAYTVTGVDTAHNTITIRNPWGHGVTRASPYLTLPYPAFQAMFASGAISPLNP